MSNQFYKYLSKKLMEFFKDNLRKVGERYYLQLDDQNQVEEFYSVLKNSENAKQFKYKHEKGNVYETIYFDINGIKLVVASTVNNTTSAYLVTIRNCTEKQEGTWKNTAIFILCGEPIDSIKSGCKNLINDGMPFNVKAISSNLKQEIENSELSRVDKEISNFYVNKKLADLYNTSLWDYEDILGILNKGLVEKEDYRKIGIFIDKELETYKPKLMEKRLKENYDLFEKVADAQEYEDKEAALEKHFDESGIKKLSKEEWKETDFTEVKKSYDKNKNMDKTLKYKEKLDKTLNFDRIYWEKEKIDTAPGRRKRQIIIFNHGSENPIRLKFEFDQPVLRMYIAPKSKEFMSTSGNVLTINLNPDPIKSSFYKLIYKHNNQAKSTYEFNIAIVNLEEKYLENIKSKYEIKGEGDKGRIQINNDGFGVKLGKGSYEREVEINEPDEIVKIDNDEEIKILNTSEAWEEDSLNFILSKNLITVPMTISEETFRSKPIKSNRIWKSKREFKESFKWEGNKIRISTNEYHLDENLRKMLNVEKEIIEKEVLYGNVCLDTINKKEINISKELQQAYINIIKYYKKIDNIPSLTYIDETLRNLYEKYLEVYNKEIESIKADEPLSFDKEKLDLLKIGTIKHSGKIIMTPLSPLNVSYQLEVLNKLSNEEVDYHILERLRPNNLLPFIYGRNDELYKPIFQKENVEWIIYEKSEEVSIGETNAFMARVVSEKLEQFIKHFKYLFPKDSKAPIKINLINIKNDREIVKGIFEYIKKQIFEGKGQIIPVEIRIFNSDSKTAFDEFFSYETVEKLEEAFGIKLSGKNNDFDKIDVIRLVLENIKYYKHSDFKECPEYSHISFYKVCDDDRYATHKTSDMETGISLGGILATVSSNRDGNNYRTGFGSKNILNKDTLLIRTILNLNELASNINNRGENPYRKDTSIVTKPLMLEKDVRDKLYNLSHWVTFIEPNFGLEYFNNPNNKEDLIIIHYSDQYTKSDQYDTITVTNKSHQYIHIIEEYLKTKNIKISEEEAYKTIKSFNSINGEWLLNLIANKSQFDREKLSIIAAIKYGLAILNHEDIIWIPISLEEILRVSGAVKLNKSEGIFSIKSLKEKGIHSDDLIFIGVNIKDHKNLKLYYYPVEVKIGYNFTNVVQKGKSQVEKTYEILKNQLSQFTENGRKLFKNMFFRNFFIQLFIANEQKFSVNELWKEKNIERIEDIKELLLNDEYEVSFELEEYIGKGALISFKKDNHWRSVNVEDEKLIIELTEDDAYSGVKDDIESIYNKIILNKSDIDINKLLCKKTLISKENYYSEEIGNAIKENEFYNDVINETKYEIASSNQIYEKNKMQELTYDKDHEKEKNIRVLLGQADGSTKEIYWEFGNKGLSNRHLLITGKSGQGKTYFIQCELKELIEQGISGIIIDYTEGFKSSQLEPKFKEFLGDKLKHFIVARDKFPIDIFAKGKKELDDNVYIDEDSLDVAERFKSVIGSVYKDLGAQQLNCIYQAVIRGMDKFNGKLNLSTFRQELQEDTTSYAQTALAQLNLLIDKNPFESNNKFSWDILDQGDGKLFIIQLTGFTKDVQKIITEMILWDLWNYKLQHGTKDKPFVVVLDEAQNLNFKDDSPSTRILTEGRKFGWSAWFATQFLKGQMDKATISRLQNSGQKIYFAQTEEEAGSMASSLSVDTDERKSWIQTLVNLRKGTCIAQGPILDKDGKLSYFKPVKINIKSLDER